MDQFWLGIIIGAVISIITSILANLWTGKIQDFVEGTKRLRLARKRAAEMRVYRFLKELRRGSPEALVELSWRQHDIVMSFLYAWLACSMALASAALYRMKVELALPSWIVLIFGYGMAAGGLFFFWTSWFSGVKHRLLVRKLTHFSDYEVALRKRWGDSL